MRRILVNHLLEPPGRVTGITRFLFAILAALLDSTADSFVLLTTWSEAELPSPLLHPRLLVLTRDFVQSTAVNVLKQNLLLSRVMREVGASLEFNPNPLGGWRGAWPRIVTVHDLYLDIMPNDYPLRHRLVWKTLFPVVARRASAIVAPSTSTKRDLVDRYPICARKVSIIPEAPAFAAGGAPHAPPLPGRYGLMVGNLSPNKNVAVIVEALHRLEARGLRIPILHVGRDEIGALSATQRRHPLAAPIVSIAGVDDATLRAAYENAVFFVNASLHEGFCLPVVEAQSCGAPVICSNRSALPEVAGDGALLVDPRSASDLAAAIAAVWTEPAIAASLAARGRANAARYSWASSARMLSRLFDSVTGTAPRAAAREHA